MMSLDFKRVLHVIPSECNSVLHVMPSDCKHVLLTVSNLHYALHFAVNGLTESTKCTRQYSSSCGGSSLP